MMTSIETYTLREEFSDRTAISKIYHACFDALDFSYYWVKKARDATADDWKEYAKEFRGMIDAVGLVCNQAHAPFDVQYGEVLDESNEKYVKLTRSIGSAAILGAKQIVVHCIKTPDGVDLSEYNYDYYSGLRRYGEEYGIDIALENLFTTTPEGTRGLLGTPEELCGLTRQLGRGYTCVVDLGHAAITGTKPEEFIKRMDSDLLGGLHVHDNDFERDCHWIPYNGDLDWRAIMRALKEKKYRGDLTLEIFGWLGHQPPERMGDAVKRAAKVAGELRVLMDF